MVGFRCDQLTASGTPSSETVTSLLFKNTEEKVFQICGSCQGGSKEAFARISITHSLHKEEIWHFVKVTFWREVNYSNNAI